ncbi:hypothetical protein, partial [Salmonella sp. s60093]|uniref:hypothetical protein n=1 Tax=Salmonella sp. s60093 TaxID=3159721 RepID=UPI00398152D2
SSLEEQSSPTRPPTPMNGFGDLAVKDFSRDRKAHKDGRDLVDGRDLLDGLGYTIHKRSKAI